MSLNFFYMRQLGPTRGRVCPQGRVYPQGILERTEARDYPLIALPWDWINAGVITDTNLVAAIQGTPEYKNNEDKHGNLI